MKNRWLRDNIVKMKYDHRDVKTYNGRKISSGWGSGDQRGLFKESGLWPQPGRMKRVSLAEMSKRKFRQRKEHPPRKPWRQKSAWRDITRERLEFVVKWTRALNAGIRYLDLFSGPWRVTEHIYRPRLWLEYTFTSWVWLSASEDHGWLQHGAGPASLGFYRALATEQRL